jgi:hypothetical protein
MSHEPARQVQLRRDLERSQQQQQGKSPEIFGISPSFFEIRSINSKIPSFIRIEPADTPPT